MWTITRGQRPLPDKVSNIKVDRHDTHLFETLVKQQKVVWDIVIDCIGYEEKDAIQDVSVFNTLAKHVVFISTDFVYEPSERQFPQYENPVSFRSGGYGGKKRLCELRIIEEASKKSMAWTILRPCHIYGPGSELGCLPMAGRDKELIKKLKAGNKIKLVGGGHFLQQPLFVVDLAEMILSCMDNAKSYGQIVNAAGPQIMESREYYRIIASLLDVPLKIEELSVSGFISEYPEQIDFMCHRVYDNEKVSKCGLKMPSTRIDQGLEEHIKSML